MKNLLLYLVLLCGLSVRAQTVTNYLGGPNTVTVSRHSIRVDSAFQNAIRDTNFTPQRIGVQVFRAADSSLYVATSLLAPQRWTKVGTGSGGAGVWGSISGTLSSQTDLVAALALKQNTITLGTVDQYFRGNLSLSDFSSDVISVTDPLYSPSGHSHSGLNPAGGQTGYILKKNSNTDYDYSWQPDTVSNSGGGGVGDMLKSIYDANNNGSVDQSERLGGQLPAYYGTAADVLARVRYIDTAAMLAPYLRSHLADFNLRNSGASGSRLMSIINPNEARIRRISFGSGFDTTASNDSALIVTATGGGGGGDVYLAGTQTLTGEKTFSNTYTNIAGSLRLGTSGDGYLTVPAGEGFRVNNGQTNALRFTNSGIHSYIQNTEGAGNFYFTAFGGVNSTGRVVMNTAGLDLLGTLKIGSVANDNAETNILVWNSTDKVLEYRTVASLPVASHVHSASTDITTGTLPIARGGTGLSTIGTVGQQLRVASNGTSLEFFTPSSGTGNADSAIVYVTQLDSVTIRYGARNGYYVDVVYPCTTGGNVSGNIDASQITTGTISTDRLPAFLEFDLTDLEDGQFAAFEDGKIVNVDAPTGTTIAGADEVYVAADGLHVITGGWNKRIAFTDSVSSVTYDTDAQAYFDRVTAAGGTLTTLEKTSWNAFVLSAKASGYYSKFSAAYFYPYLGSNLASKKLNAISSSFTQTTGGSTAYDATGVNGDGSTGYINTGFNPNGILSTYNFLFGTVIANTANQAANDIGAYETLTAIWSFTARGVDGYSAGTGNSNSLTAATNGTANAAGIWGVNRTSSTSLTLYQNNVAAATNTGADAGALPNMNIYLLARNASGGAQNFSTNTHKVDFAGASMDATQWSNFVTHLTTFLTAIGR